MDDDEYDGYDEYDGIVVDLTPPARRFRKIDLLVISLSLVADVAQAVADNITLLHDVVAMHANFKINQAAFADEAGREIEALVNPPEEE